MQELVRGLLWAVFNLPLAPLGEVVDESNSAEVDIEGNAVFGSRHHLMDVVELVSVSASGCSVEFAQRLYAACCELIAAPVDIGVAIRIRQSLITELLAASTKPTHCDGQYIRLQLHEELPLDAQWTILQQTCNELGLPTEGRWDFVVTLGAVYRSGRNPLVTSAPPV